MTKKVNYSVVKRKKPNDAQAAPMYYAVAQSRGDVSIREIALRIQQTCTVTHADVMAVLAALEDCIIDAMKNGEIIRLADIGSMQIGLKSKGALSEEEFETGFINKAHINFRPGIALVGMLKELSYAKVDKRKKKEKVEEEEEVTE